MEFAVSTSRKEEVIDLTEQVQEAVKTLWEKEKKLVCNRRAKAVLIQTMHTTCAVWLNEASDKQLCQDILSYFSGIVPAENGWKHKCLRENADAHIKASLVGASKVVHVKDGVVQLGTWQKIALVEFDGPQTRKIIVELL